MAPKEERAAWPVSRRKCSLPHVNWLGLQGASFSLHHVVYPSFKDAMNIVFIRYQHSSAIWREEGAFSLHGTLAGMILEDGQVMGGRRRLRPVTLPVHHLIGYYHHRLLVPRTLMQNASATRFAGGWLLKSTLPKVEEVGFLELRFPLPPRKEACTSPTPRSFHFTSISLSRLNLTNSLAWGTGLCESGRRL